MKMAMAALLLLTQSLTAAELPVPRGNYAIQPFGYAGVRLDDGPLLRQVLEVRTAYLRVPNDDYLKGFRRRAGLSAPGVELGGWYAIDRFIPFGQVLSGLARMYAATGDEACREKLNVLITEWGKCIEPDGYFYYSRNPNAHHYGYEKMVCGLVDAYVYAGNTEAPGYLARITNWAEKHLDRTNPYAFNGPGDPGEWYTLGENLYRAFLATGEARYRDFAAVWEYTDFWRSLREGQDFTARSSHHHAYSHVNSLNSSAMAYRVSGRKEYLETVIKAYDYLQNNQTYATGGYGPGEQLLSPERLRTALDDHPKENHFETQCASWAAFKLCKSLIAFTGDARYGDWIERLIINGTGASLPISPTGEATYYAHYSLCGASKDYSSGPWTCCSGTRIQAVADYTDLIYFKSDDALCVNLYTPSTCSWSCDDYPVTLRQLTRFPEAPSIDMTVSTSRDVTFSLKLRSPGWLAAPLRVSVNGKSEPAEVDTSHWVIVRRKWHDGDRIHVDLPMALQANPFPANAAAPFPTAITFGPTVLALRTTGSNPVNSVDFDHLDTSLSSVAGEPLTFRLKSQPDVLARPLYAFERDERYFVYFDPTHPWTRIPLTEVKLSAGWNTSPKGLATSVKPGSFAEHAFDGTALRWVFCRFDDAGIAEVRVDEKVVTTVDLYGSIRGSFDQHDFVGLLPGKHTVRITLSGDKNAKSKNHFINIVRFEAMTTSPLAQ